ncbi:MAG TPA: Verru_Chthon cassette protein C [Bacteroidia bacterium]|nr:Verru_Chthon cassette protein C [Bacteroidia bacterium]
MKGTRRNRERSAFSLIELMVAMAILSILMMMLTVLLSQVQKSYRFSESRISQFREARVAFDLMAKNIGQASLNTYWDMVVSKEGEVQRYAPTSELHFVTMSDVSRDLPGTVTQSPVGHAVFFQAPLGFSNKYRNLNNLFNGRGYFVAWGSDENFMPSFVRSKTEARYRYRLMEFRPPAESNQVFQDGYDERVDGREQVFDKWYKQALSVGEGTFESHLNPLAENIVAIIISPRDTLEGGGDRSDTYSKIAPAYAYDSNDPSRNDNPDDEFASYMQQVPPLLRLTMVAIDEGSAVRMGDGKGMPGKITKSLSGLFTNSRNFESDVAELSNRLSGDQDGPSVDYKIFSTLVLLRSAKWTGK